MATDLQGLLGNKPDQAASDDNTQADVLAGVAGNDAREGVSTASTNAYELTRRSDAPLNSDGSAVRALPAPNRSLIFAERNEQPKSADNFFGPEEKPQDANSFFSETPSVASVAADIVGATLGGLQQRVQSSDRLATTAKLIGATLGLYDPNPTAKQDSFLNTTAVGRVLNAFGEGMEQGWGASQIGLSPETEKWLRDTGFFNDYEKGQTGLIKSFNEAVARPSATAFSLMLHPIDTLNSVIGGYQGFVAQTGAELGQPLLGRDIAALPEALIPELHAPLPSVSQLRSMRVIGEGELGYYDAAPSTPVSEAGRMAATNEVLRSLKEEEVPQHQQPSTLGGAPEALVGQEPQAAVKKVSETPKDIHAIAREIAPKTMAQYDDLILRRDTYRRWIDDLNEQRRQTISENPLFSDQIAALDAQERSILEPVRGVEARLTNKKASMLDDIRAQRDDLQFQAQLEGRADTPDMAQVRDALTQVDYRLRDLAPDVSAAYRDAQSRMPDRPFEDVTEPRAEMPEPSAASAESPPRNTSEEGPAGIAQEAMGDKAETQASAPEPAPNPGPKLVPEPATKANEALAPNVVANDQIGTATEKPASETPSEAPPFRSIADDVSAKLVKVGRPQAEADAAAALVEAHYEARASRFGGAKGSADDLYRAEGPDIVSGRQEAQQQQGRALAGASQGKRGGVIFNDAKSTIYFMEHADASTFIHETGHTWLNELIKDGKDAQAPADLLADVKAVRDWLKSEPDAEITRVQHEKFARGFERYMMEGRAPSQELARVFAQFKEWLTAIYQKVSRLRSPITDDIRDVFDRLITKEPKKEAVIAHDLKKEHDIAESHQRIAESTSPAGAGAAADQIKQEAQELARKEAPEIHDEFFGRASDEVGRGARAGDELDGGGNEAGPIADGAGVNPGSGIIGEGGNQAAQEGPVLRTEPESNAPADITTPATPIPAQDKKLLDKAGNIRLDLLGTPEEINQVMRDAAEQNGQFMTARKGVVADQLVIDLAENMAVDAKDLNIKILRNRFMSEDDVPLAARLLAANKLLVQSATEVKRLMSIAAEGTDADVMAYAEASQRHMLIQETISGVTAESGRLLRAFQLMGGEASKYNEAQNLSELFQGTLGKTIAQLRAQAVLGARLLTTGAISGFLKAENKGDFWDKVLYYWMNNALLSGWRSHLTYAAGSYPFAFLKAVPETAVAAAIGHGLNAMGIKGERVYYGEVQASLHGMWTGSVRGVANAYDAMKSGQSLTLPEEVPYIHADPFGGITGKIIGAPSRIMVGGLDALTKTLAYEQAKGALVYRQAVSEGHSGAALQNRIGALTQNPTPEIMKLAVEEAQTQSLMGRGGAFTRTVAQLTNTRVFGVPALKFVMPFVRISTNVIDQALIQRSPLGFMSAEVRDNLLGKNGSIARDTQAARLVVGSSMMLATMGMASLGYINGAGPSDPKEAAISRLANGPPHSVRIGDMWYDIRPLEPIAMLFSTAADFYQVSHEMENHSVDEVGAAILHATATALMDSSWMRGASDAVRAINEPAFGEKWIRNQIASFVPLSVGLGQTARLIDPYVRRSNSIMDAIKNKIPGLSQDLMPLRDVWGEPIPNRSAFLGISTIYEEKVKNDPVEQAMLRLGVYPAFLKKTIRGVELTDQQYDDLARISGRYAKIRLDQAVSNPGFSLMPPGKQSELLTNIISGAREQARNEILRQNPLIVKQAIDNKSLQLTGGTKK